MSQQQQQQHVPVCSSSLLYVPLPLTLLYFCPFVVHLQFFWYFFSKLYAHLRRSSCSLHLSLRLTTQSLSSLVCYFPFPICVTISCQCCLTLCFVSPLRVTGGDLATCTTSFFALLCDIGKSYASGKKKILQTHTHTHLFHCFCVASHTSFSCVSVSIFTFSRV